MAVRRTGCFAKDHFYCVVALDGAAVWEGKAPSEPAALIKALTRWRDTITLVGIEACPLSEWLYGALVESVSRRGTRSGSCHLARTRPTAAMPGHCRHDEARPLPARSR